MRKILLMSLIGLLSLASAADQIYVIRNARIVTVSGPQIENGSLLIRDGKIAAIGKNVKAPGGSQIIDARGLSVYPGMIDGLTILGLTEIGSIAATNDYSEMGDFNPHLRAAVAINPHSEHIAVTRLNGVTAALTAPRGGIISGQSALINLAGWTPQEMIVKDPVAVHINYPSARGPRFEAGPPPEEERERSPQERAQRAQQRLNELKRVLRDAQDYAKTKDSWNRIRQGPLPKVDLMLEALVPAVKGELPVVISADREEDIKGAIQLADEFKLKVILSGGADAWKLTDQLKYREVPVLLGPVFSLPLREEDPYDAIFANAAALHKAGVKFAFTTGSAADSRNLPYHAATAAAFGLPKEEALRAVTIYPAQILGVADKLGSLDVGKIANVIVADGDPLEVRTQIKYLFINGRRIELRSRHTDLYEKFSRRR